MDNNTKLILMVAEGKMSMAAMTDQVMNDFCQRINRAIMPINQLTAPFAVAALMNYVEEISKLDPDIKDLAAQLTRLLQEVVRVETKETVGGWNL